MSDNAGEKAGGCARILVLGGSGMLGHKLCQTAAESIETIAAVRGPRREPEALGLPRQVAVLGDVDARNLDSLERAIAETMPAAVVNCIGVVKQSPLARDPVVSTSINALFPHQLASICQKAGARLIHLSTDCVFSGHTGSYTESAIPDPVDLYGRSKLLGELAEPDTVTLRTSMIGRELHGANGLVEWFLSQKHGSVRGFRRSIFSGFTTLALSRLIVNVVVSHPEMTGMWHIAAAPISKYELLSMINDVYDLGVAIEVDDSVVCDRTLNGERFKKATGLVAPSWKTMIEEMYDDPTPYEQLRRLHARR